MRTWNKLAWLQLNNFLLLGVCCPQPWCLAFAARSHGRVLAVFLPSIDTNRVAKIHRMPSVAGHFRKRTTNYRTLLGKMTFKEMASYDSAPPCTWIWTWQHSIRHCQLGKLMVFVSGRTDLFLEEQIWWNVSYNDLPSESLPSWHCKQNQKNKIK